MKAHPRREFLFRVLAVCGTPLFGPAAAARAGQNPQVRPAGDVDTMAAAGYFGAAIGAAKAIGEAYLRQLDVEPARASILEHTSGVLQILATARNQKAALTALVAAVRRDFQEGRVLAIEGWILSRTEAELCALTLLHV
jgi:hypothetical protein